MNCSDWTMYSGFISMKSLGLGHMATTWKPLWKYGILMKDSQAKAQKPVQIHTHCFSRTSLGKSNQLYIIEWFKNHSKFRMISSDAHLESILVFTDLMKTACSDGELVCSLSAGVNSDAAQIHWSGSVCHICLFSCFAHFLSALYVFYSMKTACSNQEDVCSFCVLPHKESRFGWLASKASIIPAESYRLAFISVTVKGPPRSIWFDLCSTLSCHCGSSLSKGTKMCHRYQFVHLKY